MRRDPATGIKWMQQKRLEDQQQAALQWLAGEQAGALPTGTGTGGGPAPTTGAGGISPQARKDVLIGGLLSGNLGGAAMKLGELQQQAYLQDYTRGQELINVTDPQTGAVYQVPRGQVMPGQAQPIPSGIPAPSAQGIPSGQPAPPVQPIPSGQPSSGTPNALNPQQRRLFLGYVMDAAKKAGLDWRLLDSVLMQESGYNPNAVGDGGASGGIAQLNRNGAGKEYGLTPEQAVADPIKSIYAAADYLKRRGVQGYNGGGDPNYLQNVGQRWTELGHSATDFQRSVATLGGGVQVAQAPGGPVSDAGAPGLMVKRPPAQELQEQERIKQQYQMEAEQRAEQARLAAEQRAAEEKLATEQRAGPNKLTLGGEEAWVEAVYKPALLEQKGNAESLQKLQLMEGLNQTGKTGPGAPLWKGVRAFLSAAGVPQSVIDVTPDQELTALSNNLVWQTLSQQKGPQTDNDFMRMQQIWPSLEKTPDANQFLIDSSRAIIQRRQAQIEFYRRNYQKYAAAGNPSALDAAWAATPTGQVSIWDAPEMQRWKQRYSPSVGGPAAPTGAPAGGPAGGGKSITRQQLQAEAAKAGIPEAEAERKLRAAGYAIQ
jgi:hypothetical protein